MTPQHFIAKWKRADLSERSACQQHFLDLCELLGHPKPAEVDPNGSWFTFEKGADKVGGGKGWADVWLQAKFGREYKGKHKDLKAAYQQLLQYRESLENPPLLVVCDLNRFEIHTNFTGTIKTVHAFDLDGLADPKNILLLRNVFTNPEALKPGETQEGITQEIAATFSGLADGMRDRGVSSDRAAHFLMKLMFCMFAQKIEALLPRDLIGEPFGADDIQHFNGGLFADSDVIDLLPGEIDQLLTAARCDWSQVEPSIFGTLFERTLDPNKRSQIGAHYTSRADIETLLKPVMMEPLRREWAAAKEKAEKLWARVKGEAPVTVAGLSEPGTGQAPKPASQRPATTSRRTVKSTAKARKDFEKCLNDFLERLAHVTVLDPACGSGNFLYVALHLLLDLEKEVLTYATEHAYPRFPRVGPAHQLFGLEINPYAKQLAQVVIWIGYLQWMQFNGFLGPRDRNRPCLHA